MNKVKAIAQNNSQYSIDIPIFKVIGNYYIIFLGTKMKEMSLRSKYAGDFWMIVVWPER